MSETYRTSIKIAAPAEQVFDHFVRPELLVRWMGDFARLEAVENGVFSVDINGVLIRGHFVRIDRPRLIEIAWGQAGTPAMPPGARRLVVTFEARAHARRAREQRARSVRGPQARGGLATFHRAARHRGERRRTGARSVADLPARLSG
jgi:uncharacterized protein YndB with AHSA1/START domain